MNPVPISFVDTSGWYAHFSADDANHADARKSRTRRRWARPSRGMRGLRGDGTQMALRRLADLRRSSQMELIFDSADVGGRVTGTAVNGSAALTTGRRCWIATPG